LFAIFGHVRWPLAIAMALTSGLGGYVGARYGRRLPNIVLKSLTIVVTISMTFYFFIRAY